jgi:HSF-type DNA-binding
MSAMIQTAPRSPFGPSLDPTSRQRTTPILPQRTSSPKSPPGDPMQVSSPSPSMGPPVPSIPDFEQGMNMANGNSFNSTSTGTQQVGVGAVAAAQGPKVVQTAFIHKLYNMLEDQSIQHLISWSSTNESFVMSPSSEFSRVLAQYFKHTNISSFVRQLNMYGFHKVSDVFHTGSPDSALWEFKHGNGSFKKGDLMGLREIKRRASRHTLIHRDSFSGTKQGLSQPGTPAETMPADNETRIASLEYAFHDMHTRLARTEDSYTLLSTRCQALTEGLVKCHQWTYDLAHHMQAIVPTESRLYTDVVNMQKEIARQLELVRALEYPQESLLSGRQPYFSGMTLDPPMSPRGFNFDESRRSSIQLAEPLRFSSGRPPVPPIPPQFASSSPRRYGSTSAAQPSPGFSRPPIPSHPLPNIHPLSSVISPQDPGPNITRRHTSADIREHGWPIPNTNPTTNGSPFASGHSSVQWPPSSPGHTPQPAPADQALRDTLASYELNGPRRQTISVQHQPSPPLSSDPVAPSSLNVGGETASWSFGGSKFPRPGFELHSAPATRRGSMASNVHSLLNPAETVERDGEDEENVGPTDERKRKRVA